MSRHRLRMAGAPGVASAPDTHGVGAPSVAMFGAGNAEGLASGLATDVGILLLSSYSYSNWLCIAIRWKLQN